MISLAKRMGYACRLELISASVLMSQPSPFSSLMSQRHNVSISNYFRHDC